MTNKFLKLMQNKKLLIADEAMVQTYLSRAYKQVMPLKLCGTGTRFKTRWCKCVL